MKKLLMVCLVLILSAGCGTSENSNQNTEVIEMAEIKTMMVPMRKNPVGGILDAVAEGMSGDGNGIETEYVDMLSNESTLKLQTQQRMLIILPANQTTPYHWTDLEVDESILTLTINEYVPDLNPEEMMGVGGHRVFEIMGIAPGKTVVETKQAHVADSQDVVEEFSLEVIVGDS